MISRLYFYLYIFLILFSSCHGQSAKQHLQDAFKLYSSGQPDLAIESALKCLDIQSDYAEALHLIGVLQSVRGDFDASIPYLEKAVKIEPKVVDFRKNLANAYAKVGKFEQAKETFLETMRSEPKNADTLAKLGAIERRLGNFFEAERRFREAIRLDANIEAAYVGLSMMYMDDPTEFNLEKAEAVLHEALAKLSRVTDRTYTTFGHLYHKYLNRFDDALLSYEKAIASNPQNSDNYVHYAIVRSDAGDMEGALQAYEIALQVDPNNGVALLNSADVLDKLHLRRAAAERLGRAIEIGMEKKQEKLLLNYAILLTHTGLPEQAVPVLLKYIENNSTNYDGYSKLGSAFYEMKKYSDAAYMFQIAVGLNDTDYDVHYGLGRSLKEIDQAELAADHFVKGMRLEYNLTACRLEVPEQSLRLFFLGSDKDRCEWRDYKPRTYCTALIIRQDLKRNDARTKVQPLSGIVFDLPSHYHLALAKSTAVQIVRGTLEAKNALSFSPYGGGWNQAGGPGGRLNVAFMSADLRLHPVCFLVRDMLAQLDRTKVKVTVYALGTDDPDDPCRLAVIASSDSFLHMEPLSRDDSALRIYEDRVNILVDLMGHTHNHRLEALALRPAPINVHALGYPSTIGGDFVDYFISDNIASPAEQYLGTAEAGADEDPDLELSFNDDFAPQARGWRGEWTEKLVYMPYSYQINSQVEIAEEFTREQAGLPEDVVIFTSMSQPFKVDPLVYDVWLNILERVPKSVIWMFPTKEPMQLNFKAQASARGINPDRIIFLKSLDRLIHLGRLQHADIALDTRVYGLHTTAADCLWRGVPVLTCSEYHFARRVAASVVTAMGLPNMVTGSWRHYEETAVLMALSMIKYRTELKGERWSVPREAFPEDAPDWIEPWLTDPDYDLPKLHDRVWENRLTHPPFDSKLYADHLVQAFESMWARHKAGLAPDTIYVKGLTSIHQPQNS